MCCRGPLGGLCAVGSIRWAMCCRGPLGGLCAVGIH